MAKTKDRDFVCFPTIVCPHVLSADAVKCGIPNDRIIEQKDGLIFTFLLNSFKMFKCKSLESQSAPKINKKKKKNSALLK